MASSIESSCFKTIVLLLLLNAPRALGGSQELGSKRRSSFENAYVVSLASSGRSSDYATYIATRVMLQSLMKTSPQADVVVLASPTVPHSWIAELNKDGHRVRHVKDIGAPWPKERPLNKLWAWNLTEYNRVILLEHDNLVLQNVDELFLCGEFCAAYLNPCYFHTSLVVLQPSRVTFEDIQKRIPELANKASTEQQLLNAYFPRLLDGGLFLPSTLNGSAGPLVGQFRLPPGYQMDASFYYYQLRWILPCSPNGVIVFPRLAGIGPWHWYSWPLLPLGLMWHEHRRTTFGYQPEIASALVQALLYVFVAASAMYMRARLNADSSSPSKYGSTTWYQWTQAKDVGQSGSSSAAHLLWLRIFTLTAIVCAFILPGPLIPGVLHPVMGWGLYLLGSLSLLTVVVSILSTPLLHTLTPWLVVIVALGVLTLNVFKSGLVRFLALGGVAFLASPIVCSSMTQVLRSVGGPIDLTAVKESHAGRSRQNSESSSEFAKLC